MLYEVITGLDVFRDFDARVGGTCGFVNAGFLVLAPWFARVHGVASADIESRNNFV